MRFAYLMALGMGCGDIKLPNSDTLAGKWEGDVSCQDRDFFVISSISEVAAFDYTGQMRFDYTEAVQGGVFNAQILYDFTAIQSVSTGAQDVYFNMTWSKLGCWTDYDNGEEETGGCESTGLNTSDYDTNIGYVKFYFDGAYRLAIDDDNCAGILYREETAP